MLNSLWWFSKFLFSGISWCSVFSNKPFVERKILLRTCIVWIKLDDALIVGRMAFVFTVLGLFNVAINRTALHTEDWKVRFPSCCLKTVVVSRGSVVILLPFYIYLSNFLVIKTIGLSRTTIAIFFRFNSLWVCFYYFILPPGAWIQRKQNKK